MTADDMPPPRAAARRSATPIAGDTPAADHDGFTTSIEDELVPKLPDLQRPAKRPKSVKEPDGVARRSPADFPDDEPLRRKLTICRDCK